MKFKKLAALSTAVIMSASMLVGCGNSETKENADKTLKIGMVADIGGINDESFNQSAWEGLQQAEKDFGIEVKVIESGNRCRIHYEGRYTKTSRKLSR